MTETIGLALAQPERRWTWWRYHEQVQKRRKEGGIHGFSDSDVQATYEHMAAADMADDYEAALAELRAQIVQLEAEVVEWKGMYGRLRKEYKRCTTRVA